MNITIINKRITIESDDYNKTFDFTKVEFNGNSLVFDNETINLPIVQGATEIYVTATLNEVVELVFPAADPGDAITNLKEHLKRVELFFLANSNATPVVIEGAVNQYYNEVVSMTQGVTAPVEDFYGGGGEHEKKHAYSWNRIGNLVTMNLRLQFFTAGVGVQELVCNIPEAMPTPASSAGFPQDTNSAEDLPWSENLGMSSILSVGNCNWGDTGSNVGLGYVYIINGGTKSGAIRINHVPQNTKFYQITLQYFTEE
jgi:hypothetical protein